MLRTNPPPGTGTGGQRIAFRQETRTREQLVEKEARASA
jgi:hypothetical protein